MLSLRCCLSFLLIIPLLALNTFAQSSTTTWDTVKAIAAGTELRVVSGTEQPVQGTVSSVTDTELVLLLKSGMRSFPRAEVKSVSVKKANHRLRNFGIGIGIGTAAGTGIGWGAGARQGCGGILCEGGPVYAAVGGVVGMAAGTAAGLLWPTGGWRTVYMQ